MKKTDRNFGRIYNGSRGIDFIRICGLHNFFLEMACLGLTRLPGPAHGGAGFLCFELSALAWRDPWRGRPRRRVPAPSRYALRRLADGGAFFIKFFSKVACIGEYRRAQACESV